MEILFKDDECIYFIEGDKLHKAYKRFHRVDLSNIKHLDDVKILYQYRDVGTEKVYPVYYEYNDRFITKLSYDYDWLFISDYFIKDYTLTNLKLLDGNIIQR